MLRNAGLGLGAVLLAVGLLGASPAEAHGKRAGQWGRRYGQHPPYRYAYGYRANRAGRNRFPDRFNRIRVSRFGTTYRRSRVPGFGMNDRPSRILGYRMSHRRIPRNRVIYHRRPGFGVNDRRRVTVLRRSDRRIRVPGFGTNYYRDFDRDGIPDSRDRDIDGDGVRNNRDRYDRNRFRW